jgi:hypothetical protein
MVSDPGPEDSSSEYIMTGAVSLQYILGDKNQKFNLLIIITGIKFLLQLQTKHD